MKRRRHKPEINPAILGPCGHCLKKLAKHTLRFFTSQMFSIRAMLYHETVLTNTAISCLSQMLTYMSEVYINLVFAG